MSDRERIFADVRAALASRTARAALPDYPLDVAATVTGFAADAVATFVARLERVSGRAFTNVSALGSFLREQGALRGYCDPLLHAELVTALGPEITLETALDRARIDDYAFGITRAVGAIAETGTLILDDATTSTRLAAIAPWIHVSVVRRADFYPHLAAALAALGDDPNVVWVTGPSKTADIEGILIEGVHGPGEEIALILD